MKLISHVNGVAQVLASQDEYLPLQQASAMMFVDAIAERYRFQTAGESQMAASAGRQSPAFQSGQFTFANIAVPVLSLDFRPDRIVAACSTTEQAEAFQADLIEFLRRDHGFRPLSRVPLTLLQSSLVVDYGPDFGERVFGMGRVQMLLSAASEVCGLAVDFKMTTIRAHGAVSVDASGLISQSFTIEERAGRPPGSSWLFSQAPFSSTQHLALMEQIETTANGAFPH